MAGAEREQWVARAIAALDTLFPEGGEHESWSRCERLLPHALLCVERAEAPEEELVLASVAFKAAQYLQEGGRNAEAKPLYQNALRICEQQVGPEHADVAAVFHKLADLFRL